MNKTPDAYDPIDCGVHDVLLEHATLGRVTELTFRDGGGHEITAKGVIADVFTRDGAEYLRLQAGDEIRLDQLVQVDDLVLM